MSRQCPNHHGGALTTMTYIHIVHGMAQARQKMQDEELHLVVHPNEELCMAQIGLLQSWYGTTIRSAHVTVPSVTPTRVAAGIISSLYLFPHIERLVVRCARP